MNYPMKKKFYFLFFVLSYSISFGQSNFALSPELKLIEQQVPSSIECPSDATGIFTIWPGNGFPPGGENRSVQEQTTLFNGFKMTRNVVVPTITMYKPKDVTSNGTAVIVAPGGAFHFLAMEKEGYEVARWLNKLGVTAFVLKYRVQLTPVNETEYTAFLGKLFKELPRVDQYEVYPPVGHPQCEEARLWGEDDGKQAIRFLRQHASELGIDPNKIGIMGFSAGGGISVNIALQNDSLSRPDFVGGIYPGYRIATPVAKNFPPLFLAVTDDDSSVAPISTARLYEDWHKKGQSVELHIFANGKHGFGMQKQNLLSDAWLDLFKNWMAAKGFLPVSTK